MGAWLYLKKPAPAPEPAQAPLASLPAETPAEKPPEARPELNYKLEPFLVPLLKSKDGGRLLLISLSLEVGDPKVRDLLNPRKVAMRDLIYRLLRDRPADEIKSARTKHLLETQIKTELNHYLGTEVITQVRFTDFVITG
ncbi:MAG: flagellar basal body-associated FliL family protein [Desulfarculus sp.]|nr:flagellar basal body-associated FliL family protein [Desulfarculus sp.]